MPPVTLSPTPTSGNPNCASSAGHDQVARQRELAPGAEGVALHGGDHDARERRTRRVTSCSCCSRTRVSTGVSSGTGSLRSWPAQNARPRPASTITLAPSRRRVERLDQLVDQPRSRR